MKSPVGRASRPPSWCAEGTLNLSLVPKLRLWNPLFAKLPLGKTFK